MTKAADSNAPKKGFQKKPRYFWNYKNCREEALKYSFKSDFRKNSMSAYKAASKKGFLDKICNHMVQQFPNGHWDVFENVKKACKGIKNRRDLQDYYPAVYFAAKRNGWLDILMPLEPKAAKGLETKKIRNRISGERIAKDELPLGY